MANKLDEIVITAPAFTMNAAPHWVAINKGFFREEGLDVQVHMVLGDRSRDEFLGDSEPELRGRIVFNAPGGSAPFKAAKAGRKEINIVSVQSRAGHCFVAKPEITSPEQLKGKRIIAGLKGASYIDARYVLKHFGLDPEKDVEFLPSEEIPPDTERGRLQALLRGECDAICSGPPHWVMAVKAGFRRLTSAQDIEVRPEGGLSTSPEIIEKYPYICARVVRAMIRGTEFARLNREETVDNILRATHYVDRDTVYSCYDAIHNHWYVLDDEKHYQHKIDLYAEEYHMEPKPLSSYFNLDFVRQALAELRLYR